VAAYVRAQAARQGISPAVLVLRTSPRESGESSPGGEAIHVRRANPGDALWRLDETGRPRPRGGVGGAEPETAGAPATVAASVQVVEGAGTPEATARARKRRAAGAGAAAPDDAGRRRVLAVDDSKAMLAFYRSALPRLGLAATTADNGQAAWDILETSDPFDCIVADMNMPVMDGIELTRLVRGDMAHAATPILMATTESTGEQVELALRAGVTGFLKKPFTAEALAAELSRLLS